MALQTLRPDALADWVLRARYAAPGERDPDDVRQRVARALAEAEEPRHRAGWRRRFLAAMRSGFIPAGRILASAGREIGSTWANCFVQPLAEIPDDAGILRPTLGQALTETVRTLRAGGGVGVNLSPLADPVAALHAFNDACAQATGHSARPGALMGLMDVDHPRIEDFIEAKRDGGLTHFNLSVVISDAFMQRIEQREPAAQGLWDRLALSAWSCGEPGVVFIDTVRRDDALAASETIVAVNPCGEQPLPAYGSCCLGSIDLTRFVRRGLTRSARIDDIALAHTVQTAVRLLDNAIDLSPWPLPAQAAQARRTRRIGLGLTGLADALMLLGVRYGSADGRRAAVAVLQTLRQAAFAASVDLARERGCFPAFDAPTYLAPPGHASRLPAALRAAIRRHGLRNSHLLSLAPAGGISLAMAGGVSSGIEPVWGWQIERLLHTANHAEVRLTHVDPVWRRWCERHRRVNGPRPSPARPSAFETVEDIAPSAQLAMVAALAPWVDGGISKTLRLPPTSTPHHVSKLLQQAWRRRVKGLTVYRSEPGRAGPVDTTPGAAGSQPRRLAS